jgi:hypothetical protein
LLGDVTIGDDDRDDLAVVVRDRSEVAAQDVALTVWSGEIRLEVDVLAVGSTLDPPANVGLDAFVASPPGCLGELLADDVLQLGVDVLHRSVVDVEHRPVGLEQAHEDVRILEHGLVAAFLALELSLVLDPVGDVASDANPTQLAVG